MYLNSANDEYPHDVEVIRRTVVKEGEYPYTENVTEVRHKLKAFMDTPSSSQQINYHNLNIRLDRVLYLPFGSDIQRSDVFVYDNETYEFVGDLQDQGGQHIVWNAPVRRVADG